MYVQRFKRSSGIVMPIFSLPSPYGIGTIVNEAYKFVDFLEEAGQTFWQVLPLGHTDGNNCPYQCYSVAAGNPIFIDLDNIVERGLINRDYLKNFEINHLFEKINYLEVTKTHYDILKKAYNNASFDIKRQVEAFCKENSEWLDDYALFMALTDFYKKKPVWEWNDFYIKKRNINAIAFYTELLEKEIEFYKFIQYLFFEQWDSLKAYANCKNIKIIGDIPMYPSPNSCDVWVNSSIFKVDENLKITYSAGTPPDYFSEAGQLWGNPIYNWDILKETGYKWWINRIRYTLRMSDVIRLDHFRAFQDYWAVPVEEKTAINGKWYPGPRIDFFNAIKTYLGNVPFIAEDLGMIGDDVREFLAETGLPGMAVMIFGLHANEDNIHLPHNWAKNSVGYTSTHDSETIVQAIQELDDNDRNFALEYINVSSNPKESLGFKAIKTAFMSHSDLVMIMASDLLSLGKEGRINVPGTVSNNNWSWRAPVDAFNNDLANKLKQLTITYKRT